MDSKFYKFIKPVVKFIFRFLYRPEVKGIDNIPGGGVVLVGNHTKWLDPIMIVACTNRQVHFLAKDSLFKGLVGYIVRGMGAIPVNRKTHDKEALCSAKNCLKNGCVVGVFPEGTINRTNDVVMPFKIGAVKMSYDTDSFLVPFVIKGKYQLFRKSIKLEFLEPIKVSKNLSLENNNLMALISSKLEEN